MADYEARVAPFIKNTFYLTGMYGVQRPTHMHVGVDLATPVPINMYSILDGTVIHKGNTNARGNYIVIKGVNNYAFLYQHMAASSPLNIGDNIKIGQFVGVEGTTGEITGLHLHMEMQILNDRDWYFGNDISYYINPCDYMGFPNQTGISIYYDGIVVPPEPPRHKTKWSYRNPKKIIFYS